jgi:hypothetical protein
MWSESTGKALEGALQSPRVDTTSSKIPKKASASSQSDLEGLESITPSRSAIKPSQGGRRSAKEPLRRSKPIVQLSMNELPVAGALDDFAKRDSQQKLKIKAAKKISTGYHSDHFHPPAVLKKSEAFKLTPALAIVAELAAKIVRKHQFMITSPQLSDMAPDIYCELAQSGCVDAHLLPISAFIKDIGDIMGIFASKKLQLRKIGKDPEPPVGASTILLNCSIVMKYFDQEVKSLLQCVRVMSGRNPYDKTLTISNATAQYHDILFDLLDDVGEGPCRNLDGTIFTVKDSRRFNDLMNDDAGIGRINPKSYTQSRDAAMAGVISQNRSQGPTGGTESHKTTQPQTGPSKPKNLPTGNFQQNTSETSGLVSGNFGSDPKKIRGHPDLEIFV